MLAELNQTTTFADLIVGVRFVTINDPISQGKAFRKIAPMPSGANAEDLETLYEWVFAPEVQVVLLED